MPMSLDELKKILADEEKALRDKYAKKLAAAKKRERTAKTREAKKFRAVENHGKYLLAGFVLAEAKRKADDTLLKRCLATLTKDREREALKHLIASVSSASTGDGKQSSTVAPSSKPLPPPANPQK